MHSGVLPASVAAKSVLPTSSGCVGRRAFTLIELLVVMAIIVVILAMVVPAFTKVDTGRQLTLAAYNISGALENARAYARANNTYTWVGFYEKFPPGTSDAPTGPVFVSVVASKDNTAQYSSTLADPPKFDGTNLVQIGKLIELNNVGLTTLNDSEIPTRAKWIDSSGTTTPISPDYLVGASAFAGRLPAVATNNTTFNYPLTTSPSKYTFSKIIQFNPLGDATKIVDTPRQLLEIDLRAVRNGVLDSVGKNCVAIQITGIGGQVRIYQPQSQPQP